MTRHGILRERFADVLTDTLRAAILRLVGYRVEVIEFVDSKHTPRNALIRAVRTGAAPDAATQAAYRVARHGLGRHTGAGDLTADLDPTLLGPVRRGRV